MLREHELYHYGVLGMKWGIRRYQNPDGSLTAEGKKKARQEYREDNREAAKRGYDATVAGKALNISLKKMARTEKRYNKALEKDPDKVKARTERLYNNLIDRTSAVKKLEATKVKTTREAEEHCKKLIKKYGKEAVSTIKYKQIKNKESGYSTIMNEAGKMDALSRWATIGSILGAFGMMAAGSPIGIYSTYKTSNDRARELSDMAYYMSISERKSKE